MDTIFYITSFLITWYIGVRIWIDGGRGEVVNTEDCGSSIRGFDSHRSPQRR